VPFRETVLLPCVSPKFWPCMVTVSPRLTVLGNNPVMETVMVPWATEPTE